MEEKTIKRLTMEELVEFINNTGEDTIINVIIEEKRGDESDGRKEI